VPIPSEGDLRSTVIDFHSEPEKRLNAVHGVNIAAARRPT
jgi:hypothetical protein